ncbi:MAG: hypothetical protein HZB99_02635 [Candidatus Harrisonbacteria bacterium]|nr:hypothetical protein [Candidatus Harrisonbacteria bacterium]
MTLRTRRILFYGLTLVFIFIGTIVIFYSSGWRFDLETMQINKLGALFFETITPTDATITIDKNKFEFHQGFLQSGILIANLFPKTYTVRITKEGYQNWIKELEVFPSLVTTAPPIVLLPEKPDLNKPLVNKIADFWVTPEHLITLASDGTLEFGGQKIIGNQIYKWSKTENLIITTQKKGSYFLIDLDHPSSATNLSLIFANLKPAKMRRAQIQSIDFHPLNENQFIISTTEGLFILNIDKLALASIHENPVSSLDINNAEIIFTDKNKIFLYNLTIDTKEFLTDKEFQDIRDIQISPSKYLVSLLEKNGQLYIFDRKSLNLTEIAENISKAIFAPDSKKIAAIGNNKELSIYYLADPNQESEKNEKPAHFNIGSIQEEALSWHKNSNYLFIKYPSNLYLLEANNLLPINFQMIDLENKKYQYGAGENSVYLLKNGSLYKLPLN